VDIIKNKIANFGSCFFDALFPRRCVGCGLQGAWLCVSCEKLLFFRPNQDCLVCGRPNRDGLKCSNCISSAYIRRVMCACSYRQSVVVKLVKMFKYDFVKSINETLASLLIDFLSSQANLPKNYLVVPVPLHQRRRRWRGYNQSALLAQAVAKHFSWQYDDKSLVRYKSTQPQAKMETSSRCLNVDGCFLVRDSQSLSGKKILLIDDVITTGATIEACALVLKKARAKSVDALALVRG